MEANEFLVPIIAGGICLAISIYGLAIAKDRFFALGGLFLYSFIPISHRLGLFLEDPQDYFSFATIVIFIVQAILAYPRGGFLSPNKDSVQKTWSLKKLPSNSDAHNLKGSICKNLKIWDEAEKQFY